MLLARVSAAGSLSVRAVTSIWQKRTSPGPSRYSRSGLYWRAYPPSTMGRKSPRGGFSISTDATLPQLPQRHSRVISSPHQLTVGAPLYRGLNLYARVGGSRDRKSTRLNSSH